MTKEHIIAAAAKIIQRETEARGLHISNKGTGHAFDNTFWKDCFVDDSEIPNIIAVSVDYSFGKSIGYQIELRSFWGGPEISIRDNGDLLVIQFSDSVYDRKTDKLIDDGNFRVREIRVDSYDYEVALNKAKAIVKEIETYGNN